MTCSECHPVCALQGGETQRTPPIVPKDQLDALGAESAGAIIQEDGRGWSHPRVSSGKYRSPPAGLTRIRGETSSPAVPPIHE